MSFYKFENNDLIINKVRSNPETRVYVVTGSQYVNNSGQAGYEPIPYISGSVLTIDKNEFAGRPVFVSETEYTGSSITGSFERNYSLSSSVSIASEYAAAGSDNRKVRALKNTLNYYTKISPEYAFSSSLGDKAQQDLMLVSVPSLMYGSSIQEGSVDLKFYVTGSLAGQLTDSRRNGELIQTSGDDEGKVAGVSLKDGTTYHSPVVVNVAGPHSFIINRMAGVEAGMNIKTRALRQEVAHVPAPEGVDYEAYAFFLSDGDIGCYSRPEVGNHVLIGSEDPECDRLEWVDDPDNYNKAFTN